jgi:hypothetical protein
MATLTIRTGVTMENPNEPHTPQHVRVAVVYEVSATKPRPVWFELRNEQCRITEICYFWRSFVGESDIYNYSVLTAHGPFDLAFNIRSQTWTLIDKADAQ